MKQEENKTKRYKVEGNFRLKPLTSHKNRPDPSGSYVSASFRFESKVESKVKKDTHIRTKLNENENESENKNETGEATYVGALRAPFAGSPVVVFVSFHFVWVIKHGSKGCLITRGGGYLWLLRRSDIRWICAMRSLSQIASN